MGRKKLLLYPTNEKRHTIYGPTIALLKKNYELIYILPTKKTTTIFSKLAKNRLINLIYRNNLRKIISMRELKSFFFKPKKYEFNQDLIFSSNTLPNSSSDFVLDLEIINALGGYDYKRLNKDKIKSVLEKDNCKAIICWNEISKRSLIETIDCKKFMSKIYVVPFAMPSDKIRKDYSKKTTDLLFVSSINNPYDFELKGGLLALEVYKSLLEKYDSISFTIRANVPSWIRQKYQNLPGLNIIEHFLPDNEMKDLFIKSDILLEPVPGINLLLDCMNYALPAIIFDFWCLPEMILDGKNGLLINSKNLLGDPSHMEDYLKNIDYRWRKLYSKNIDQNIIKEYVEKSSFLIQNSKIRKKMGTYSKSLITRGLYSLPVRNKKLLSILKKATST